MRRDWSTGLHSGGVVVGRRESAVSLDMTVFTTVEALRWVCSESLSAWHFLSRSDDDTGSVCVFWGARSESFKQCKDGFDVLDNKVDLVWFESGHHNVEHVPTNDESSEVSGDAILDRENRGQNLFEVA